MSFRFNPLTGEFDQVGAGTGGPSIPPQAIDETRIALEPISALKAVYFSGPNGAGVSDPQDTIKSHARGVALTAANLGETFTVRTFGEIEDASFSWSADSPIFVGALGVLTDAPPAAGFLVEIAKALGTGAIFVNQTRHIQL